MELFLDANAHLPMSKPAIDAFIKTNSSLAGHGHALSPSVPGRAAEAAIEEARNTVSDLLGSENPNQLVFTSTCTEACSWGLDIFRNINENKSIYISPAEHPAVRQAAKELFLSRTVLNTNKSAYIDLSYPIQKDSAIISIFVQNEVGTIQPINDLGKSCSSLFSDMSQAPGKIELPKLSHINNLDVSVFGAHKFGGPASVGILYVKDTNKWFAKGTGSRYFLDRPGTPDTASIVATAAALKHAINTFPERNEKMKEFRDVIEPEMEKLGFEIIGKYDPRINGTTFAKIPNNKYSQIILQMLGNKGIYIGLGSACGSIHSGKSPLINILNRNGCVRDFVRISHYGDYGKKEAEYFVKILKDVCER